MKAKDLLNELTALTQKNLAVVETFATLPIDQLTLKQDPKSWSVLECIEHLNRYGYFYIPEITKQIESATKKQTDRFKPGVLGNYFAKSMLPKQKLNKMKTFSSMNPLNCALKKEVLTTFIHQQQQMLELLTQAKDVDLTAVKTPITLSKWVKLRLGDTFRFVIYHNLRHI